MWRLNLSKAWDAAEFEDEAHRVPCKVEGFGKGSSSPSTMLPGFLDAQIVAARVRLQIAFANVPCFGLDWTPDLALDCGLWTVLALAFLVL